MSPEDVQRLAQAIHIAVSDAIESAVSRHTTLRDELAMAALQGDLASPERSIDMENEAAWAYEMADCMLEAREREGGDAA